MDRRKFNSVVAYVSRSLSAAALIIWGVVNIVGLAMQQAGSDVEDANWTVSWLLCGLFGFTPFLFGAWLLYRNLARSARANPQKESTS